jgi:predicted flap endonuclease-1-like 5' DNA nuclease
MPDLTSIEFGLLGVLLLLGLVVGWIIRGARCATEKIAVNAGWQEQIARQRLEHERLAEQNKSLMEQISENQASHKDSKMRAQELSDALKETFERRDVLQRQLKEVRGNLEVALAQRDKFQADKKSSEASKASAKEKDDKIFYLSRELQSWQDRVPPLVERFQARNSEANELEVELQKAKVRIAELESMADPAHTRIEPVGSSAITDGLDASNDQYEETSAHNIAELGNRNDHQGEDQSSGPDTDSDDKAESEEPNNAQDADLDVAQADDTDGTEAGSGDADSTDNLRLIRGVGPAIENTLNDLGIFRFSQISEMSEYDIDRIAQEMKGFRSRIYREDWVGQARLLQQQKNDGSI